jgi:hypothetical protein
MPYGGVDYARIANMAGNDEVVSNSRTRANLNAITLPSGGTIALNPLGTNWITGSGTPVSTTPGATSTLTIANLLTGFIVQAPSAGNTSTLDTAANIVSGINSISAGAVVGDVIQVYLGNGSAANTITVAAGSGGSFDANQPSTARVIAINSSRFVFIRLTNVTSGSEAYTVYI